MSKPYFIGITGGSASGKTKFLQDIISYFDEDQLCVISQDNYYYPIEKQAVDSQGVVNFDLPETIDQEAFEKDILSLASGNTISLPEYTFNNPDAPVNILTFKPAPIIIVEGIFVLYYENIAKHLDLRLFIDAKEHIKLKRRIVRDNEERGYDLQDVLYRYEHHVAPTYEQFIEPCKEHADLIIPNNKDFETALGVIIGYLSTKLS